MDIILFTATDVKDLAASSAGMFTIATNQFIPSPSSTTKTIATSCWTAYISLKDNEANLATYGLTVGGNNTPVLSVQPKFYPVATRGAECSALVTSLNWADLNLSNYEYMLVSLTQGGDAIYFVTGVLNSSQTQANDPFGTEGEAQGLVSGNGCCWAGTYTEGLNPF